MSNSRPDYMNPALSPAERAAALLPLLSIREKLAQLTGFLPVSADDAKSIAERFPHGLGQVSSLQMRGLKTAEEAAGMQRAIQAAVMDASPHRIPAIFHMEGLCGAFVQDTTSLPSGLGRASGWDPELEEKLAEIVGRQERAIGVTNTLAPVLDISRDSRMGRQGETYGEDPTLAAALGAAYTRGVQRGEPGGLRTDAVAKHFLGFHAGAAGIHGADTQISPRELREVYAKPFQAAIAESGLRGVMPCYCSLNGVPVSANGEIMNDLLRGELGFDGVVVSDYSAISNIHAVQHVAETPTDAGLMALSGGLDVELPSPQCYTEDMALRFERGEADMAILDRAALRVLTAKFRMGLFEHPFALTGAELRSRLQNRDDEALTLRSARESLVLLKNDGALPIRQEVKRIAVSGAQAKPARVFFGGYTHLSMAEGLLAAAASMAGVDLPEGVTLPELKLPRDLSPLPGSQVQNDFAPEFDALMQQQKPGIHSLYEELKCRLPGVSVEWARGFNHAGDDESGFAEALELAGAADLIVVTLGGKHGTSSIASMGEGVDAVDIGLPAGQERFLEALEGLGKPVVGVHFNGRPISSDVASRVCSAILEAWNPAEKGAEAIVDALLGQYNPSGKLPVSVAWRAGQIPVYYNHPFGSSWHQGESIGFANYVDCPHTPRYPFGFGLSYTTFAYENLRLDAEEVGSDGTLTVSVEIANTGDRDGEEIAQLYLSDEFASVTRPNQELAGFRRVSLKAGERKTLRFRIDMRQLAFLGRDMRWRVEAGRVEVRVGGSSDDIRCRSGFRIADTRVIDRRDRRFWAESEVI